MSNLINPTGIIFINTETHSNVLDFIVKQLNIDEVIDGYEFDNRISNNPSYPSDIHAAKKRIIVIKDYRDLVNRDKADIVLFIKNGLCSVEKNKFGPPGLVLKINQLYLQKLFVKG
jgi:hypothetical protein